MASPLTAMFPELRYIFPLLRCHQTNVENVCPAQGRCLWKERQDEAEQAGDRTSAMTQCAEVIVTRGEILQKKKEKYK